MPKKRFFLPSVLFYILLMALFIVSFCGLFITIMEVDATQYANMSLELLRSKSLIQFTDLGEDYLDKPPLLFWFSALSISIFGNTTWVFKLPSFIMAWSSVFFLYKFVKTYYNSLIARLASLMYAGSVAFILFSNDIRTDTLMISFVTLAIWQYSAYIKTLKFKHLFIAAFAIGMAMLAKGPIGLVVPVLALGPHILIKGNWKAVLNWKMLFAPLIVFIVLTPMLIGLYQQFGVDGIRFYFWEQSFGRITGENVWKNDASYFYFLHNIAWAFIPFILFLVGGLILFITRFKSNKEYISFFGFVLPFIALSMSHYKLPHYIYVCIPFAAVLAAVFYNFWFNNSNKFLKLSLSIVQYIIVFALSVLPLFLFYAFEPSIVLYVVYVIFLILMFYILLKCQNKIFLASISAFILASFTLNTHAYPSLLKYQSSSEAAFYINKQDIDKSKLYQINIWNRAFHYYCGFQVPDFKEIQLKDKNENYYIFLTETDYNEIKKNTEVELIKTFDEFSVTRLSLNFLNPKTRKTTLKKTYLIKL